MSSIDTRVVRMEFDNVNFKRGAAETKDSLDKLNKALDSTGKSNGLNALDTNVSKVRASISSKVIGITTVITNLTNRIVNMGFALGKSMLINPIKEGMSEYEALLTKQNTIMNATGLSAEAVKKTLDSLNSYSDKTIYKFSDMTSALTQFTNAGVSLKDAEIAIKGASNAAAHAGASAGEASRGMYAFTQMMQAGKIGLQDWRQVENAAMGTQTFKKALMDTAVELGTLTKRGNEYVMQNGKVVTSTKGFNASLAEGWATSETLTKTLSKYADATTDLGKRAFKSAQEVRTFSGFMDTMREALGSGWASVFYAIGGGLESSTKTWTKIANTIGNVIVQMFNFASATITTFRSLGGMKAAMEVVTNIASPLVAVLKAVGKAWNAVFPAKGDNNSAGKSLVMAAKGLAKFTEPLQNVAKIFSKVELPLKAFFTLLKSGLSIIVNAKDVIVAFAKEVGKSLNIKMPSADGLINWFKNLAESVSDALDKFNGVGSKIDSVKSKMSGLDIKMPKISGLGGVEASLASASNIKAPNMSKVTSSLKGSEGLLNRLKSRLQTVATGFTLTGQAIWSVIESIGSGISKIAGKIKEFFQNLSYTDVVAASNQALVTTFTIQFITMIRNVNKGVSGISDAMANMGTMFADVGAGVTGFFDNLGGALKSFQTQAKAKIIINIAIAIGVLAVSLLILSLIPQDKLARGLGALAAVFTMLIGTMHVMTKMLEKLNDAKLGVTMLAVSGSMFLLAAAVTTLAIGMILFNYVDTSSLFKAGVAVGILAVGAKALSKIDGSDIIKVSFALNLMALAIFGISVALLVMNKVNTGSIVRLAFTMGILTVALGLLALIPYEGIAKVGLAMLTASAGILVMAAALIVFSLVKVSSIIKMVFVLQMLTLALLAIAIIGNAGGSAAILALAAGITMLAVAGLLLNNVEWTSLFKLYVILMMIIPIFATFMLILAVASYVAPGLVVLGAGLFLVGAGLMMMAAALFIFVVAAGAGVTAISGFAVAIAIAIGVFFQTLAGQAPIIQRSILTMLQALIDTIVTAVPMILKGIRDLWNAVVAELSKPEKGKQAGEASKSWVQSMSDGIKAKMPMIVDKGAELLVKFLQGISKRAREIGRAGSDVVAKFIRGIGDRVDLLVREGTRVITKFIQGVGDSSAKLADTAAKTIVKFVNDLSVSIRANSAALREAARGLGSAIISGLTGGISDNAFQVINTLISLGNRAIQAALNVFKVKSPSRVFYDIGAFVVQGLTQGIRNNATMAIVAVASLMQGQIAVAQHYMSQLVQSMDQNTIAAQAKADALRAMAQKAEEEAKKAKNKKAKKAANTRAKSLNAQAEAAEKEAENLRAASEAQKEAEIRRADFEKADLLGKAKMTSEDAQNMIDAAKASEQYAASSQAKAAQLRAKAAKMAKGKAKQAVLADAAMWEQQAALGAQAANDQLNAARNLAAQSLEYQRQAGAEAAKAMQDAFDQDAKAAAEVDAYEKASVDEKIRIRTEQANQLQAAADADLERAKQLAYTDIEGANTLAQAARDQAQQAREYLKEIENLNNNAGVGGAGGGIAGTVVNLDPTDAAAIAMNNYSNLYSSAVASAAATKTVQFNQYNTSPESLSASDIYRQTNNLFNYAASNIAA